MRACVGEKRQGGEDRAGRLARWLGRRLASWAGLGGRGPGGLLRWLQAATLFLFVQTEIETEKHRVKGEEFEYKENILKLLELSTI